MEKHNESVEVQKLVFIRLFNQHDATQKLLTSLKDQQTADFRDFSLALKRLEKPEEEVDLHAAEPEVSQIPKASDALKEPPDEAMISRTFSVATVSAAGVVMLSNALMFSQSYRGIEKDEGFCKTGKALPSGFIAFNAFTFAAISAILALLKQSRGSDVQSAARMFSRLSGPLFAGLVYALGAAAAESYDHSHEAFVFVLVTFVFSVLIIGATIAVVDGSNPGTVGVLQRLGWSSATITYGWHNACSTFFHLCFWSHFCFVCAFFGMCRTPHVQHGTPEVLHIFFLCLLPLLMRMSYHRYTSAVPWHNLPGQTYSDLWQTYHNLESRREENWTKRVSEMEKSRSWLFGWYFLSRQHAEDRAKWPNDAPNRVIYDKIIAKQKHAASFCVVALALALLLMSLALVSLIYGAKEAAGH